MWGKILVGSLLVLAAASEESRTAVERCLSAIDNPPPYRVSGPSVSIIIPTYNEEKFLPPLLDSIRNQTYSPIEVVVADCSTDSTPDIARSAGAVVVSSPKSCPAVARNDGANGSSGEILIFMDADCIPSHDFTERLVSALQNGAALAHGNDVVYDSGLRNIAMTVWGHWKPRAYTTGRGVAVYRDTFFAIGGYDESCTPLEDCREDWAFGNAVRECYGIDRIVIDRSALVATSARRPLTSGGPLWKYQGYRNGAINGVVV